MSRLALMQGITSNTLRAPGNPQLAAVLSIWAAALSLAGCSIGSSGNGDTTIPPDQATQLEDQLGNIQSAVVRNDCAAAKAEARRFADMAQNTSADAAVKNALSEGAAQMTALVQRDVCTDTGATSATTTPDTATATRETTTPSTTNETTTEEPPSSGSGGGKPGSDETSVPPVESPGNSGNGSPGPSGNPGRPITGGVGNGEGGGG